MPAYTRLLEWMTLPSKNGKLYQTKYAVLLLAYALILLITSQTVQCLIKETLIGRKNISPQNIYETSQLYAAGALKIACLGLQCIGFNKTLYATILDQAEKCHAGPAKWSGKGSGLGSSGTAWNASSGVVGLGDIVNGMGKLAVTTKESGENAM